jgi:hypothetical protein
VLTAALLPLGFALSGGDPYTGPKFIVGACTHLGFKQGILSENLSTLKQAGIMATRDELTWGRCEDSKGTLQIPAYYSTYVDTATAMGLIPLNILDYGNKNYDAGGYPRSPEAVEGFARYAELVATTFKSKIRHHQVWNEWDGGCGMPKNLRGTGDPESYMNLIKAVYPRLKKVDPDISVVANSICTGNKYLETLLNLDLLHYCDVVSLHTYNYGETTARTPEAWRDRMEKVGQMLRDHNDGKEVPLFVTEMGWPTHIAANGTPPEESASFLARLYLLARTLPYIKGVWWYDYQDDGWDWKYNEANFGMTRPDLTPKPSYYAMADISGLVANADFTERLEFDDKDIWALKFKLPDGKDCLALWSSHLRDGWQITLTDAGEKAPVTCLKVGTGKRVTRSWGTRNWIANRDDPLKENDLDIVIDGRPVLVEGALSAVTITKVVRREYPENKRPKNVIYRVPEKIGRATPVADPARTAEYDFGNDADYRRIFEVPRQGRDDLSATFSAKWDADNLYLDILVTDNTFCQEQTIDESWKGDGIQMAFQELGLDSDTAGNHTELDAAMTPDGPKVYRRAAQGGAAPGEVNEVELNIDTDGPRMTYRLKIPVKTVDLPVLKPDVIIGFSLLVNDNDGDGRKGYLHWGDGIGQGKNPLLFNWLLMEK